ncbi:hypothetical protein HDU93_000282 [Gonapodya sp. JEL0774]|nr:hypothetical protein HDU93_000282 [Gonapodya sp. JEL0774]
MSLGVGDGAKDPEQKTAIALIHPRHAIRSLSSAAGPPTSAWVALPGRKPIDIAVTPHTSVSRILQRARNLFPENSGLGRVDIDRLDLRAGPDAPPLPRDMPASEAVTQLPGGNSASNPLLVTVETKTILVLDLDDNLRPTGTYTAVKIASDVDLRKMGRGLKSLDDPATNINSVDQLVDGGQYMIDAPILDWSSKGRSWVVAENAGREAEIRRALEQGLEEAFGTKPKVLPRLFSDSKRDIEEWDGCFAVDSVRKLFVLEVKHAPDKDGLDIISWRAFMFIKTVCSSLQRADYEPYLDYEVVPVVGGVYFPEEIAERAEKNGMVRLFPSGSGFAIVGVKGTEGSKGGG